MMLPRSISMICLVILVGCGDDTTGRDVANCTAKAMELFKPQDVDNDERSANYVQVCMIAAGYQMEHTCWEAWVDSKSATGLLLNSCWYPDSWWERWKRRS